MKVYDSIKKEELDLTTEQLIDQMAHHNRQVDLQFAKKRTDADGYGGVDDIVGSFHARLLWISYVLYISTRGKIMRAGGHSGARLILQARAAVIMDIW